MRCWSFERQCAAYHVRSGRVSNHTDLSMGRCWCTLKHAPVSGKDAGRGPPGVEAGLRCPWCGRCCCISTVALSSGVWWCGPNFSFLSICVCCTAQHLNAAGYAFMLVAPRCCQSLIDSQCTVDHSWKFLLSALNDNLSQFKDQQKNMITALSCQAVKLPEDLEFEKSQLRVRLLLAVCVWVMYVAT